MGAVRALALALTGVALAGCLPYDNASMYSLWVVNTGGDDRVVVLGNDGEGNSTHPALLIPADGFPRSTFGSTIGTQAGAVGAVLVYDLACTLVTRVELGKGSYLLTIDDEQATIAELARPTEPAGVQLAADAPRNCPGGAPP